MPLLRCFNVIVSSMQKGSKVLSLGVVVRHGMERGVGFTGDPTSLACDDKYLKTGKGQASSQIETMDKVAQKGLVLKNCHIVDN